jgi:hypothetical protein
MSHLTPTDAASFVHDEWHPAPENEHPWADQGGAVQGPRKRDTSRNLGFAPRH